jgi:hypothetical protein
LQANRSEAQVTGVVAAIAGAGAWGKLPKGGALEQNSRLRFDFAQKNVVLSRLARHCAGRLGSFIAFAVVFL